MVTEHECYRAGHKGTRQLLDWFCDVNGWLPMTFDEAKAVHSTILRRELEEQRVAQQAVMQKQRALEKKKEASALSEDEKLKELVAKIIKDCPELVRSYKEGHRSTMGALIGTILRATHGKVDVAKAQKFFEQQLTEGEPAQDEEK